MLRCILGWFIPLSVIAIVLSGFEVFPQQYHLWVGIGYILLVFVGVWHCISHATKRAWSEGQKAKVQELRERKAAKLAAQQDLEIDERYQEPNTRYH
jgi:ABC-type transport system involved in cytochrome bd biosynthesis fused ATPase/permease subunit